MQVFILKAQGGFDLVQSPDVAALLAAPNQMLWVDMDGPTDEDVQIMEKVFHLHPLAIEDATNWRQPPKVDEFGDVLFTILNTVELIKTEVKFRELDVFLGKNFLVTVHRGKEPIIAQVLLNCSSRSEHGDVTIGYVMYSLVETVVNSYFPVLDEVGDRIEHISQMIVEHPRQGALERLFKLKHTLTDLWRIAGRQRDMLNLLTREDSPLIQEESLRYYMRDVYDHILRVSDTINTFRDTLASTAELYMAAVSNRLNIVVERLTVITVGVGIITVITSFFGMNYRGENVLPPLDQPWGLPLVIGLVLIVVIVTGILLWWLER
jgi:magnesium transporter